MSTLRPYAKGRFCFMIDSPICPVRPKQSQTALTNGVLYYGANMATRREPTPQWLREKVFERDNYTCRYCGSKEPPFNADHVYPYSLGGQTTVENLVTACSRCNGKKSN